MSYKVFQTQHNPGVKAMTFSRLKSVAKRQENDKYDFHLRKSKVE